MRISTPCLSRFALAATLGSLIAIPVQAQTQADNQLEDIVVTATKRQENVQNIPIAVSAFGAEALQRAGVQDTRQLMAIAPSLIGFSHRKSKGHPIASPIITRCRSSIAMPTRSSCPI